MVEAHRQEADLAVAWVVSGAREVDHLPLPQQVGEVSHRVLVSLQENDETQSTSTAVIFLN